MPRPPRVLVVAAVACVAALMPRAHADKLQYFGVWDLEGNSTPVAVAPWSNFLFTNADPAVATRFYAESGIKSLLYVESTFLCGTVLCPDYQQRWATLLNTTVRPMLASGALFGVFFGDELAWRCVSWDNITAMVDTVRSDLPRGQAVLYYNEAFPVFTDVQCSAGGDFDPHRQNISYPRVPDGLDWLSLDYYPDEGTAAGVQKLFEDFVYPKLLGDEQRVLFVPPAYGSGNNASVADRLCCSNNTRDGPNPPCHGNCTAGLLQWAQVTYDWARTDEKVIGLNPWHWTTRGDPAQNPEFEPGLNELPLLRAAFETIGREIVSGRLGDVHLL